MAQDNHCPKCGASLFWADDIGAYCTSCGWKQASRQPVTPQYGAYRPNASSYGGQADAPLYFNWGALFLTWAWCLGMRVWGWAIGVLVVVVGGWLIGRAMVVDGLYTDSVGEFGAGILVILVTYVLIPLIAGIYLGFAGNSLAWRSRRFESEEQFNAVQRIWGICGLLVFILAIAYFIVSAQVEEARLRQKLQQNLRTQQTSAYSPALTRTADGENDARVVLCQIRPQSEEDRI